jgi:hypothetical protein
VIFRAHYLGSTTAQIAIDLKIPDPIVKLKLHHAMRELRCALQQISR